MPKKKIQLIGRFKYNNKGRKVIFTALTEFFYEKLKYYYLLFITSLKKVFSLIL